jgi:hypothetical protein
LNLELDIYYTAIGRVGDYRVCSLPSLKNELGNDISDYIFDLFGDTVVSCRFDMVVGGMGKE